MTKKDTRGSTKLDAKRDQRHSEPKKSVSTEGERLVCTQRVASILASVHSFVDVAQAVTDEIGAFIGATVAHLALAENGRSPLILPSKPASIQTDGSTEGVAVGTGGSTLVLRPLVEAVQTALPVTTTSVEEYRSRFPDSANENSCRNASDSVSSEKLLLNGSSVALPLLIEEQPVGGLLFVFDRWRTFSESEIFFYETMAHLCSLAIARIQLAEKERQARREEAAEREELQRALYARQEALDQVQEFQRLFGLSLDLICILGFDGFFKLINPAWSNTLGWSDEELLSRPYLSFVHPDDLDSTHKIASRLAADRCGTATFKNRYLCADGSIRWLSWSVIVVHTDANPSCDVHGTMGLYAVARDVTVSQQAEEALRESTQFIQKIADASPNMLYLYDMIEGRNVYGNRTLGTVLGYSDGELQEMGSEMFERLVHPDDWLHMKRVMEMLKELPDGRIIELEYRLRHRNGGYRWLLDRCMVFSRLPDGTTRQFVGASQDITVRKDYEQCLRDANEYLYIVNQTMEQQLALIQEQTALLELRRAELEEANLRLEALATTDGLTGLTNHRTFHEKLNDEFDRTRRYGGELSLLMIDVDFFKSFNDRFGHPAGDVMLKQIANVLVANTRACDILARYGGEEFAVVLPETDAEGAFEVAERIRSAVEGGVWIGEKMTVSVGIVSKCLLTLTAQQMVEEADRALYECKHRGRNTVVHYADLVGKLRDERVKYFP